MNRYGEGTRLCPPQYSRGEQTMRFLYALWQIMSPSLNLLHSILVTQKSDLVNAWRFINAWLHSVSSLRRRRNLTSFSNVCKAALWFLFWAPNGINQLPEVRFEFLFILIGQSIMAFLTGQSWRVLRFWCTGWGSEQGFRRRFADSLPRGRFSGSSHFVPSHKRLLNREQHSFNKASPITLYLPNSGRLTLTAG